MAHDARGYYKVLNAEPGASQEELDLAYGFLKYEAEKDGKAPDRKVQEAYDYLSDPAKKAAYDASGARVRDASETSGKRMLIFVGILVVLLLFAGFVFPGFLRPSPSPFHSGDQLVRESTGESLGQVVRREESHRFPGNVVGPGYLVRLSSGAEHWFPASDLERHYDAR
jgi:DnaJ-class molecular chaperone